MEAPGLGDDIQAIKAGILEIADILVVNKADRPGVENSEKALRAMLELAHPAHRKYLHHGRLGGDPAPASRESKMAGEMWIPPVLKTVSTEGKGISELAQQISHHAEYLHRNGGWVARDRARAASQIEVLLVQTLLTQFRAHIPERRYNEILDEVFNRKLAPREAVRLLLDPITATSDTPKKTA